MKPKMSNFQNDVFKKESIQLEEKCWFNSLSKKNIIKELIKDPAKIRFLDHQKEYYCRLCIIKEPKTFMYIKKPSKNLCLLAVKENTYTLGCVNEQTPEMCAIAIDQFPDTIQYVKNQTEELCLKAIDKDPTVLFLINNPTLKTCILALRKNILLYKDIDNEMDFPLDFLKEIYFNNINNKEVVDWIQKKPNWIQNQKKQIINFLDEK